MRLLLASTLLVLAAGTASAQTDAPAPLGSAPAGVTAPRRRPPPAGASPAGSTAPHQRSGQAVGSQAGRGKPDAAESLRKAQAATAARDKAWDAR